MNHRKRIASLMTAVLCTALLGACSLSPANSKGAASSTAQSGEAGGEFSSGYDDVLSSSAAGSSLGEFSTQDINGTDYTQNMFQEYDLTMVNVFTTWCTPCVGEMPDLEKLHQQVADRGVNVVGVVLDVLNEKGEIVQENLEQAQELVKRTGVTYPVLLPDSTYFNGRLIGIDAVPETFFVDKNGDIVGETYSGSGGLEDWLEVVEQELANLQEAK